MNWNSTSILSISLAVFAAAPVLFAESSSLQVTDLECEYATNPLGIDAPRPRLGWVLRSGERAQCQTAYQILVASDPKLLSEGTGNKWDSGKVESDCSVNVPYGGEPLSSGERCYWKVRVWDRDGKASDYSEPAWFEMGLLEPSDWHGQWIGLAGEKAAAVSPLLRKEFVVGGPVKRARLYAAGIGWSEYYLNGTRIGDNVLDPTATDYDKRILYVTHDVTEQVRPGTNALSVMLGNGWYSEPGGPNYGDSPRLLLQLIIELADGTVKRIISDPSWRATGGPILKNDFYGGELYDARLEKDGWLEPGYEDASWPAAALKDSPGGRLEAQLVEPIKINQVLKPVALTNPKPGVHVYDFGRFFGGWARLRVKGPAGTKVALRYASRVFPDGDMAELKAVIDRDVRAGHATPVVPGVGLVDKRHHHGLDGATDVYILKGDPRGETYAPRFTFHPVRYVQIEGFPGTPTPENLEGCVVYNAIDMDGDFECSHPLLNQIHRNCVWTFTNAMYGITLDCLYREHWGWLEPASNPAMLYARKFTPRFWTKFLRDAQRAQHPDGVIPDVVPSYPRKGRKTGDPAWAGNYPLVLWYVYRYYDDRRLLEEHYASMKRWVAYLTRIAGENHRIEEGGYYGDHMLPGDAPGEEEFLSKETPPPLLWTGYYYRNVWILAQVARILGIDDDAAAYDELAAAIRAALNDKWLDASGDHYAGGSQTANIFPLALGVVPKANRQRVLRTLIDDILVKRGGHLRTGNLGTTCIMDALTSLGGGEALFQAAASTDYPGWGYMVSRGATTIWESWGGVREGFVGYNTSEDSMVMFVTIERFFYNDILGIQGPKYYGVDDFAPGFRAFSIEPCPVGDLTWAKGHIKTVRGPVAVDWRRTGDSFSLKVAVPVGATARVGIPKLGLGGVTVFEGTTTIWSEGKPGDSVEGIDGINEDADRVHLEVGSGEYRFVLRGP